MPPNEKYVLVSKCISPRSLYALLDTTNTLIKEVKDDIDSVYQLRDNGDDEQYADIDKSYNELKCRDKKFLPIKHTRGSDATVSWQVITSWYNILCAIRDVLMRNEVPSKDRILDQLSLGDASPQVKLFINLSEQLFLHGAETKAYNSGWAPCDDCPNYQKLKREYDCLEMLLQQIKETIYTTTPTTSRFYLEYFMCGGTVERTMKCVMNAVRSSNNIQINNQLPMNSLDYNWYVVSPSDCMYVRMYI